MPRSFTVALSICLDCQRAFGVNLWPWSGEHWKQTHGLCGSCRTRLAAAFVEGPLPGLRVDSLPDAAARALPEASEHPRRT